MLNQLISEIKNIPATHISSKSGDDVLLDSLSRNGERGAAEYLPSRRPVEAITAAFEDGRYDLIVATNSDGLKIRLTNCPCRRASFGEDIICTVDRSMSKSLLGSEFEHSVEMSP